MNDRGKEAAERDLLNARASYLATMEALDMPERNCLEVSNRYLSHEDLKIRELAGEIRAHLGLNNPKGESFPT